MRTFSRAWPGGLALAALAAGMCAAARPAAAQPPEVVPFVGYRFGGDFLEMLTGAAQDVDGGTSVGAACNIPVGEGRSLEFFYTRQSAHALVPTAAGPAARVTASSEYFHGGERQEFLNGRVRPFLTGTLGLTRLAVGDDDELRFSLGAGGGVAFRANDRLALRLDGRLMVTIMDMHGDAAVCGPRGCASSLHISALWQADFTAGLVLVL